MRSRGKQLFIAPGPTKEAGTEWSLGVRHGEVPPEREDDAAEAPDPDEFVYPDEGPE